MSKLMGARAFSCPLVLACVGFAGVARAQTIDGVDFATSPAPNDRTGTPEAINYTDCIKNRVLNYTIRVTGVATIEVRTGTNCVDANNKVDTANCFLVTTLNVSGTITRPLESQAIVAADRRSVLGDGGTSCADSAVSTDPRQVTLNFMIADSSGTVTGIPVTKTIKIDLLGPPAPKSLKAGVGEQRLVLDWERPATQDLSRYLFFCDPPPSGGTSNAASTPQAAGAAGSLGTVGAGGLGVGGVSEAGTDDASTSDASGVGVSGSGGASGSTAASDGATSSSCSSILTPGQIAPVDLPTCGGASESVASGEAQPLQNGVSYAVAVAAVDALGNAGPLSNVACATPKEVNDFFETYRNSGGSAGGGFCALGARPAPGAAAFFVVALLVRRWRRRTAQVIGART
jgi:hypothetical protein